MKNNRTIQDCVFSPRAEKYYTLVCVQDLWISLHLLENAAP